MDVLIMEVNNRIGAGIGKLGLVLLNLFILDLELGVSSEMAKFATNTKLRYLG